MKYRVIESNDVNTINFRGHSVVDEDDNTVGVFYDINDAILFCRSKDINNVLQDVFNNLSVIMKETCDSDLFNKLDDSYIIISNILNKSI